jgi:single-strand DNA-binding protein
VNIIERFFKMAGYLNQVQLIGNLGRDPEVHVTGSGDKIVNLSLATTKSWTERASGEKRERTEWHRVVIFSDGLAGVVEKYLQKGSKIFVQGSLQTRKWTDSASVERYSTEIVLQPYEGKLLMLDGGANRNGAERSAPSGGTPPAGADLDGDEIPF